MTGNDSSPLCDALFLLTRHAGEVDKAGEPGWCEFRIRGRLGRPLLAAFPFLHADADGPDTVLAGPLPDEAALHGVLAQIEALGLHLLEFRRVGRGRSQAPERG